MKYYIARGSSAYALRQVLQERDVNPGPNLNTRDHTQVLVWNGIFRGLAWLNVDRSEVYRIVNDQGQEVNDGQA